MVSVKIIAGRFGFVRFDNDFSVAELARMRSDVIEMFSQVPSQKVVLLSDLSDVHAIKPEVKAPLTQVLQTDNPRIERNGVLVTRGTPIVIQAHNIISEANSRARRLFTDRAEVEAWLAEVLDDVERAALKRVNTPR